MSIRVTNIYMGYGNSLGEPAKQQKNLRALFSPRWTEIHDVISQMGTPSHTFSISSSQYTPAPSPIQQ